MAGGAPETGAMRKLLLLVAAAAVLPGCVSSRGAKGDSGAAPPERAAAEAETAKRDTGPGAGAYAAVVPENIVWLPWKMVGGAIKGAGDGVGAGFEQGRMPAMGALFSPINLVTGFVTGFFEGAAMSPGLVGPSDDFGRAMGSPMKRATTVWWYP